MPRYISCSRRGQLAGHAPPGQRVEAHLEHRLRLVAGPGRASGLVVDDADLAVRRAIDAVDEAAHLERLLQLRRDPDLARVRLEPGRVLHAEVGRQQRRGVDRDRAVGPSPHGVGGHRIRPAPSPRRPAPRGPAAASTVRSCAGRSNRVSRARWTSVPRTAAADGSSGSRSIERKRNSSGQVVKSEARDGDSEAGNGDAMAATVAFPTCPRPRSSTGSPTAAAAAPSSPAISSSSPIPGGRCTRSPSRTAGSSTPTGAGCPTTT